MRILVFLLLVACRETVHVNPEPTRIPGILKQGDTVRIDLEETAADAVEERPYLLLNVVIIDAETETAVLADLSLRLEGDGQDDVFQALGGCQHVAVCQLQLATIEELFYWIRVEAAGYDVWESRIRAKTFSTRKMDLPVRLRRSQPSA
ncbi:MAG: hypothetical protein AAF614_11600 [Chloroflexota bacterium]